MQNVTRYRGAALVNGIAASSNNDVVAVGCYSSPNSLIFAKPWNGLAWTDVSPGKGYHSSRFMGNTSDASGSYWAAGSDMPNKRTPTAQTFAEHWNGSQFARLETPNSEPASQPDLTNQFFGIAAESPNDVWAVGSWTYYPGAGTTRCLFEHWKGKKWKIEAGPPNNYAATELLSIGKVSSNALWPLGNQDIPRACREQTLTVEATHG